MACSPWQMQWFFPPMPPNCSPPDLKAVMCERDRLLCIPPDVGHGQKHLLFRSKGVHWDFASYTVFRLKSLAIRGVIYT